MVYVRNTVRKIGRANTTFFREIHLWLKSKKGELNVKTSTKIKTCNCKWFLLCYVLNPRLLLAFNFCFQNPSLLKNPHHIVLQILCVLFFCSMQEEIHFKRCVFLIASPLGEEKKARKKYTNLKPLKNKTGSCILHLHSARLILCGFVFKVCMQMQRGAYIVTATIALQQSLCECLRKIILNTNNSKIYLNTPSQYWQFSRRSITTSHSSATTW